MGRRNCANGKSKLSIPPGSLVFSWWLCWEKGWGEKMAEVSSWEALRSSVFSAQQCHCGIHVTKSSAGQRDTSPALQGTSTPPAPWGPVDLGSWRDSSPVWILVYSGWSHQQSQQFHCIWGCTSCGFEQGAARAKGRENSRRRVVSVVVRPVRTHKALFEDF